MAKENIIALIHSDMCAHLDISYNLHTGSEIITGKLRGVYNMHICTEQIQVRRESQSFFQMIGSQLIIA